MLQGPHYVYGTIKSSLCSLLLATDKRVLETWLLLVETCDSWTLSTVDVRSKAKFHCVVADHNEAALIFNSQSV